MKDCEHKFEFQSTQQQYASTPGGTGTVKEYAYLMCVKCGHVKKVEVEL